MAAQFVRLKLTILANTFRRSMWQTVGMVIALISASSVVCLAVMGAIIVGWRFPTILGPTLVLSGGLVILCWWFIPIFLFGVDETLDPQRFVLYPLARRSLLTGLTAASLVSVPGIATTLALVGVSLAWVRYPLAFAVSLVGAVIGIALCVVGSRALTTSLSPILEGRRSREVLSMVAVVLILAISPAMNWLANTLTESATISGEQVLAAIHDFAHILGWTPFGVAWSMPVQANAGDWLGVLARFSIGTATVAVACGAWSRALTRSLERPRRTNAQSERIKGLGFFDRLPATPRGAITAREATYWLRDPRYRTNFLAVIALPVIFLVAGHSGGGEASFIVLMLAPMVAWVLGFSISNDVASDYTAFALHLATGVRGTADRWGRATVVLVVGTPLTIGMAMLAGPITGHWDWVPPLTGYSLGILAASVGISSITSARWVYPVQKPGESPLKQPQGATMATLLAQSIHMGLLGLVTLPTFGLGLAAVLTHGNASAILSWTTLVVGPILGVVVLLVGITMGSRILERRGPEILQQILAFP